MSELVFGSKHEDDEATARIGSADLHLEEDFKTFNEEAMQNFYLLAGYIYPQDAYNKLIKEERPVFQTNLFKPIITRIASDFKDRMPGVDFIGRTKDDHKKAEVFKDINSYILYQENNIVYEAASAFLWMIVGRHSWLTQEYSYEKDPEGCVSIKHYKKFLKFDTNGTRRDLSDCNYIFDSDFFSPEEIARIYAFKKPDLADEIMEKAKLLIGESTKKKNMIISWAERLLNVIGSYSGENKGYDKIFKNGEIVHDKYADWNKHGMFKVVDAYERRDYPVMYLTDRLKGDTHDITDFVKKEKYENITNWYDKEKLNLIRENFYNPHIEESITSKIHQTSICPALNIKLYEGLQQLQNGNFKFTRMSCHDYHPDVLETKSVVDDIKDMVKSYNLRDNTNLTYLMRATHGGYFLERSAIKSAEALKSNKIGSVTILEDGTLTQGRLKEKTVPTPNIALENMMAQKREEIEYIPGVHQSSMGKEVAKNDSGVAISRRVQQTEVMQGWINENAQSALRKVSENNLYYIQNLMSNYRVLRLLKDNNNPDWVEINKPTIDGILNDVSIGKYDVTISTTPFGRVSKEIQREQFMELYAAATSLAQVDPRYQVVAEKIFGEILNNYQVANLGEIKELFESLLESKIQQLTQPDPEQDKIKQIQDMMMKLGVEDKQLDNEGKKLENAQKEVNLGKEIIDIEAQKSAINTDNILSGILDNFTRA